jgi:hypothetical protein
MKFKRWISRTYGTVHYSPVPPSLWEIEGDLIDEIDVPFLRTPSGNIEIFHPVGCVAAGRYIQLREN